MKKILIVFGTRPEAIKLAPLILKLKKQKDFLTLICVTAQHRDMLDSVLEEYGIIPDYDLSIMKHGQTLSYITESIINGVDKLLCELSPDIVLVHGDTSTAFAASLAAFYRSIPIGHIEAGLRSGDINSPFPEEFNRRAIAQIASLHFAPTKAAANNLLGEGVAEDSIHLVGNTVIDALLMDEKTDIVSNTDIPSSPFVLMTVHRREHTEDNIGAIFDAVRSVFSEDNSVKVIYPVHKSPRIQRLASQILSGYSNIILTEPLGVSVFHSLLKRSLFVLTDSGGVQEEAAFLGKPVLLVRENTERPEGTVNGTVRVIGSMKEAIVSEIKSLLYDKDEYARSAIPCNAFGDGCASDRIISVLKKI